MRARKIEGKFLTGVEVSEQQPFFITIMTEAKTEKSEKFDKEIQRCNIELANGKQKVWTINRASWNKLIDIYGDDTMNWIGKKVQLKTKTTNNGMLTIQIVDNSEEEDVDNDDTTDYTDK